MPYLKIDDYSLWFKTYGDTSSSNAIFLLHGFTGSHRTWAHLFRDLQKDRFVVAPDLPGHGLSGTSSTPAGMDLDATSKGITRLMDSLEVRKSGLLGYSLGGRIALNFALKHPERLTCLVLEGTSPGISDSAERERRKLEDDELARNIGRYGVDWFVDKWESLPLFASQKALDPRVIQTIRRERLSNSANGLSMSLRSAGTGMMPSLWNRLDGLQMPVLLVVGEKDEKYRSIAGEMKKLIPDCTVRALKGAGHCAHLERPEAFQEAVREFLDKHQ